MSVLKIQDEKGRWIGVPSIKGEDGQVVDHAERHAQGGFDEILPEMIGASRDDHTHTPEDIGASPANHTHSLEELGAASKGHTHTASEVGASPAGHNHDERYFTESEVNALLATKAPAHTYSTTDVEAGSASSEPEGTLHLVLE
jgi:hypothetical protein